LPWTAARSPHRHPAVPSGRGLPKPLQRPRFPDRRVRRMPM